MSESEKDESTVLSSFSMTIDADEELKRIAKKLKNAEKKLKPASLLQNAINSTAAKAKKQLIENVKQRYDLTDKRGLTQKDQGAPYITRAKPGSLNASIQAKGIKQALTRFRTRKNTKRGAAKARVLKSNSLKPLEKNGIKAFLTTFASGHVAIVQRKPPEQYGSKGQTARVEKYGPDADMTKIKQLLGPAVPQMLKQDEVREPVESQIKKVLRQEVEKRIKKALEG